MAGNRVPKYIQLKSEIKRRVLSGDLAPGAQIPTENELAKQFGISRQTVRQGITDLVHEQILLREHGRGTFVAHPPLTGDSVLPEQPATHVIGVITTYISDYIFPSIIRGIELELSKHGYSILLLSTHNSFQQESRALDTVIRNKVDGLIVDPTKSNLPNPNIGLYFQLLEHKIPLITLHTSFPEMGSPCVRIDDSQASFSITQHLIDNGHTKLGGIFKSDDLQGNYRLNGFIRATQANGLTFHQEFLTRFTTEQRKEVVEQYARKFASMPPSHRPTAVACYNDEIAIPLIKHLKINGFRVPEDVSVVGFDDFYFADTNDPPLTTVRHPKFELGVQAAKLVVESIKRSRENKLEMIPDFEFPTELVIRSSVSSRIPQLTHS